MTLRFEHKGEVFVWHPDKVPTWPFVAAILLEIFGLWLILVVLVP